MSDYLNKSKAYKGFHYSVLNQKMVDYLHSTTLTMFAEIIGIFEKNNIRYSICGGTLLGAYTTGKFIPWDDDIDICVLEDDYELMLKVVGEYHSASWELQWNNNEPNYYHDWAKIRDKKSITYPLIDGYKNNGVWIDLYKIKKINRNSVDSFTAKVHLNYLQKRYEVGSITEEEKERRITQHQLREKINQKNSYDSNDKFVYIICSASKIVLEENWLFPLTTISFENIECKCFGNVEKYLIKHYGEKYFEYPKEQDRCIGINRIEIY